MYGLISVLSCFLRVIDFAIAKIFVGFLFCGDCDNMGTSMWPVAITWQPKILKLKSKQ